MRCYHPGQALRSLGPEFLTGATWPTTHSPASRCSTGHYITCQSITISAAAAGVPLRQSKHSGLQTITTAALIPLISLDHFSKLDFQEVQEPAYTRRMAGELLRMMIQSVLTKLVQGLRHVMNV